MVKYWKTSDKVEAKVYRTKEGHYEMQMDGEKYPFPGYPRGTLLYGKLSPLKHWIKNKVFNDVWRLLEEGGDVQKHLRNEAYPYIYELAEGVRYDMVPPEALVPPVKELYRTIPHPKWRDIITFIMQEDDAYRMRLQWMVKFLPKLRKPTWKDFDKALEMLEHGEVVGDMKERVRLVRRVLNELQKDPDHKAMWDRFISETNWKKLALTEADKYFFRAKYFKVDYPEYKY